MTPSSSTRALEAIARIPSAELSRLLEASASLASSLDLDEVLQTAIECAVRVLELDTGAIYLLDDADLILGATTPPLPDEFPTEFRREPLGEHMHVRRCLDEREPVMIADWTKEQMSDAERIVCEARELHSILYVPLVVAEDAVGCFIVGTVRRECEFRESDVDLCRALSNEIGLALANARLHESVKQSHDELEWAYDATLEGWSLALEMRDDETRGHAHRVSTLSAELARAVGMPEEDVIQVRRGALLHDIGKMVVPDAILHKHGPLNEHEWAIMREHPENARGFLAKIDYLAPALDIPYCHHERWDGTGYPQGLARYDIPLSARVFAVIDSYDALTSDRPYRAAWSEKDAIDHIREGAGSHFDPDIVTQFLQMIATGNREERPDAVPSAGGS
ncbi:MAG: HD domain-containing protein [Coriobacteriia bacterium]|nr:HD domain-containing protein [Coriobacteriia bacterium]